MEKNEYIYNGTYSTAHSYSHDLFLFVNDSSYTYNTGETAKYKSANHNSTFFVNPATPTITLAAPGQIILENHTKNITINVLLLDGELQSINITMNSSNLDAINLTDSIKSKANGSNWKNGSSFNFTWSAAFLKDGNAKLNITLNATNKTT